MPAMEVGGIKIQYRNLPDLGEQLKKRVKETDDAITKHEEDIKKLKTTRKEMVALIGDAPVAAAASSPD